VLRPFHPYRIQNYARETLHSEGEYPRVNGVGAHREEHGQLPKVASDLLYLTVTEQVPRPAVLPVQCPGESVNPHQLTLREREREYTPWECCVPLLCQRDRSLQLCLRLAEAVGNLSALDRVVLL